MNSERLVGYSNNNKSYSIYSLATRCIIESRNVIFVEIISHLFPPPSKETPPQIIPRRIDMGDHNYITYDDFLRDLRDYNFGVGTWNPFPVLLLTASPRLGSQPICRWLSSWTGSARSLGGTCWPEGLQNHRKRGLYTRGSANGDSFTGWHSPTAGAAGVAGFSQEAPLVGSPPLQQRGQPRLEVEPAVTHVGTAAQSFVRCNANNRSKPAHPWYRCLNSEG